MDEMVLADVAEAEGWDLNDQNEILRVLKEKVNKTGPMHHTMNMRY